MFNFKLKYDFDYDKMSPHDWTNYLRFKEAYGAVKKAASLTKDSTLNKTAQSLKVLTGSQKWEPGISMNLSWKDRQSNKTLTSHHYMMPNHYAVFRERLAAYKILKSNLHTKVKQHRAARKVLVKTSKRWIPDPISGRYYTHTLVGGVYTSPNEILKLKMMREGNLINEPKIPKTKDRHVGIELEFISKADREMLSKELYVAGLAKYVNLKGDGSLRAEDLYPQTHEICILAPENQVTEVVQKTCKILHAVGSKINKTCGMHVHIDMRDRNRDVVFSNLVSAQNILYSMNPKSRVEPINGTRYCAPTRGKKFNPNMNRYHGINGSAYNRHGTIEVRIHAGTIVADKILNWVQLLLLIANRTEAVSRAASTFKGFVNQFAVPLPLAEYIVERIKKFSEPTVQEEAA